MNLQQTPLFDLQQRTQARNRLEIYNSSFLLTCVLYFPDPSK